MRGWRVRQRPRPYHVGHTGSRLITEVKQRRARLVLAWVTGWEYRVPRPFCFVSSHSSACRCCPFCSRPPAARQNHQTQGAQGGKARTLSHTSTYIHSHCRTRTPDCLEPAESALLLSVPVGAAALHMSTGLSQQWPQLANCPSNAAAWKSLWIRPRARLASPDRDKCR